MNILDLARQAGISVDKFGMGWNATSDTDGVDIEAFAALVRKDALEEAAAKCQSMAYEQDIKEATDTMYECAIAIRTLKESGK